MDELLTDDEAFVVALGKWCMALFDDLERLKSPGGVNFSVTTRDNLKRMFDEGIAFERDRQARKEDNMVTAPARHSTARVLA